MMVGGREIMGSRKNNLHKEGIKDSRKLQNKPIKKLRKEGGEGQTDKNREINEIKGES